MRVSSVVASMTAGLVLMATIPYCLAAQTGGVMVESKPGAAAVAETVQLTGAIAAINPETREITLTVEGSEPVTITAGPEVRNFAQLAVGDAVEMEFTHALALELKKDSTAEVSRTEEGALAAAAPGSTPGGVGGRRVQVMAEVMAVDAASQTVTLRGPERTIDLKVNDPEQFKLIAVGDRIEATYVEALAVQVTRATPAE